VRANNPPAPASSLWLACADLEIVRMHLVVVIGLLTNFAGNPLKIQCTAVETVDQAKTCLASKISSNWLGDASLS
jgi:hypothetical protein